jgi:hypothetical protein
MSSVHLLQAIKSRKNTNKKPDKQSLQQVYFSRG